MPTKGPAIKLQETLDDHSQSICDIASDKETMATSDESGKIIVWKAGGHFKKVTEIDGFGYVYLFCFQLSNQLSKLANAQ